jgi:hypothetical protein
MRTGGVWRRSRTSATSSNSKPLGGTAFVDRLK